MAYATFDHTRLRIGHDKLINGKLGLTQLETFLNTKGEAGKQGISTMQPTRVGKGVQMRHIAICANTGWIDRDGGEHAPIASLVVMVSPTSVLATQVVDEDKYRETFKMLRLDPNLMRQCKKQKVGPELDRNLKKDDKSYQMLDDHGRIKIISCTNDFLLSRLDHFKKLCKKRLQDTGLPVLFLLDEVQRLGDKTQAYSAMKDLEEDCGVLSISFTATPCRADGGGIWNFDETQLSHKSTQVKQYKGINKEDPKLIDYDIFDKNKFELKMNADVEVDWDEAWNNDWLCKVDVDLIDVELKATLEEVEDEDEAEIFSMALEKMEDTMKSEVGKDGKGLEGQLMLSSLYDKETGTVLKKNIVRKSIQLATRRTETMRKAICKMLERLKARRAALPETKALVFGGNDMPDDSDNAHLEQAKRIMASEWNNYFPGKSFRPMILTMKDESLKSGEDATQLLQKFENEDYDVIFLKQMAAEGWDTQKTKVGLMLSPIRTYSFIIQAGFRVATPWEVGDGRKVLTADLIALADPFFMQFKQWLHSANGAITNRTQMYKIDEETKERKEGPKKSQFVEIINEEHIGTAAFGDGHSHLTIDQAEIISNIRDRYPSVNSGVMTDAMLWQMYKDGAFPECSENKRAEYQASEPDPFRDEGRERREKISLIQERLVSCVKRACARCKIKLNGSFGGVVSMLAGLAADHHNRRHVADKVPTQFSTISNLEVAERFYGTVMADVWEETALRLVRNAADQRRAA